MPHFNIGQCRAGTFKLTVNAQVHSVMTAEGQKHAAINTFYYYFILITNQNVHSIS
jgi:hypothetical protein